MATAPQPILVMRGGTLDDGTSRDFKNDLRGLLYILLVHPLCFEGLNNSFDISWQIARMAF